MVACELHFTSALEFIYCKADNATDKLCLLQKITNCFSMYILAPNCNNVEKCVERKYLTLMTIFCIVHQCFLCDEFYLVFIYFIYFL
jgi:hypothetical protein